MTAPPQPPPGWGTDPARLENPGKVGTRREAGSGRVSAQVCAPPAPHSSGRHGTAAAADVGKLPRDGSPSSRGARDLGIGERGSVPPNPAARALPWELPACQAELAMAQAAVPTGRRRGHLAGTRGTNWGQVQSLEGERGKKKSRAPGGTGSPVRLLPAGTGWRPPCATHLGDLGPSRAVPRSGHPCGVAVARDGAAPGGSAQPAGRHKVALEGSSAGAANCRAAVTPSPAAGDSAWRAPARPIPQAWHLQLSPAAPAVPASPPARPHATAGHAVLLPAPRAPGHGRRRPPGPADPHRSGSIAVSPHRARAPPKRPRQRPRFPGAGPTAAFPA